MISRACAANPTRASIDIPFPDVQLTLDPPVPSADRRRGEPALLQAERLHRVDDFGDFRRGDVWHFADAAEGAASRSHAASVDHHQWQNADRDRRHARPVVHRYDGRGHWDRPAGPYLL